MTPPCTPSNETLLVPVMVRGAVGSSSPITNVTRSRRYDADAFSRTVTIMSSALAAGGIDAIVEHSPPASDRSWNRSASLTWYWNVPVTPTLQSVTAALL